jgi:hypothetical protein
MKPKSEQISLSKIESAKRLFIEAVILFFEKRDPVAIHHLVHASHELLNILTGTSFILDESFLTKEGVKVFKSAFVKSKNFIKHADRDRDALFDFNPGLNIIVLLDCALMLCKLFGDEFLPGKIYISWCAATEPGFFLEEFLKKIYTIEQMGFNHNDTDTFVMSIKYWAKNQMSKY